LEPPETETLYDNRLSSALSDDIIFPGENSKYEINNPCEG
jgi:hypothetical protein